MGSPANPAPAASAGGGTGLNRLDAVVIGAGPNGLAAAVTLAEAGRSVVVYEAADTVGGGTRTAELTLPGFHHDVCSAVHPLGAGSPALVRMGLERHGLRWLHPEVALAHPLPDGRAGVLHRSVDDTAAGLGPDADRWRRFVEPHLRHWDQLTDAVLRPLLSIPKHPLVLGRFGVSALQPSVWLQGRFASEEARALVAGNAAHSFLRLDRPLSGAFGVLLAVSAHAVGWPFAAGGSQAIADALAARLVELGGRIETGRSVARLADLAPHRVALFDTSPGAVATIAADRLGPRMARRLRRFRHGPAAFKLDYALAGPMPWINEDCRRSGTVHVGGTADEVVAAERDVARGRMPEQPFVLVAQPSVVDPSRAPDGHHALWTYAHVPHAFAGDATAAIEAQLDRFAPHWRDLVLARHVTTPAGFEAYNANYVGGDIGGGAYSGLQTLLRPTWRGYGTDNPAVLLCSASTPPGAGVHGMCGVHAARVALRGALA